MLIRSVVIINHLRTPVAQTNNLTEAKTARLWAGIFRLQDLRALHLDPGYLDFGGKFGDSPWILIKFRPQSGNFVCIGNVSKEAKSSRHCVTLVVGS